MLRAYLEGIYSEGKQALLELLRGRLDSAAPALLIATVNPEILMLGESDESYGKLLLSERTLCVPDGIGVLKACRRLGLPCKETTPGVELCARLFELLNEREGSLFLFGAKPEIVQALAEKLRRDYPRLRLVGVVDGYVKDREAVRRQILEARPDLTLAALGAPAQELFLASCQPDLDHGLLIGVGGSFDVLSGAKKRAPALFRRLHLEWAWRLLREPSRLPRFWRGNVGFFRLLARQERR